MVKKLLFVWGLLGTGCCSGLLAQTTSAFDSAVVVWEKTCRCRFYYDPEQTKALVLPQTIDDPATTLNTLFAGTGLKWFRDEQSRYFIYKGSLLSLGLTKNYFSKSPSLTEDSVRLPKEEEVSVSAEESNKVYTIGSKNNSLPTAVVTGAIRDAKSGEPVIAASVLLDGGAIGVSTDAYGAYSLTVPKGRHMLRVSSIGMKDIIRQIQVLGNGRLNIEMREEIRSLKTALVVAQKQSNIRGMQMGVERLNIKMIKNIPAVFGETDILKSLLTLPGITSVGEGTVGYNVRGGAADQNLLLLNDMTIYNPTHLFGFFSAVDPDVVRGLELYKSALPERYGGRLSSIMEVTSRDGNTKKLTGTLGIGPLTSKFSLEGPLGGEKTTFLVGGRATYSNWLLKEVPDRAYRNSKASFYDLMVHVTHTFSEADRIFLSAYISNDEFRLNQDSTYRYSNQNIRLKWKHDYTSKFYQVISAGVDDYAYSLRGSNNPLDAFDLKFGVRQYGVKADFKYIPDNRHEVNFGAQHLLYQMQPGSIQPKDPASLITTKLIPKEQATETSVYFGDQFRITDQLSVQGGIRYTLYRFLGPYVLNQYVPGSPR
ncbi:MAG: TonB-dependent receptor, partial [Chitinophagaceae bacterium]